MRSYPQLHHNVTPVFPSSKTKQWPPALSAHTHWQRLCPRVIYSPSVTQTHWPWQISQFISWLERRYTRHEPRVILGAPFQARSGTRSSPDPLGLFRNNSPIVRWISLHTRLVWGRLCLCREPYSTSWMLIKYVADTGESCCGGRGGWYPLSVSSLAETRIQQCV